MSEEHHTHQVMAALRCVDANSGRTLTTPSLSASGAHFIRNQNGDFVLVDRPDLSEVTVQVRDPAGNYLPRSFVLSLPRDPDPANAADEGSLFQPVRIEMFPAPTAQIASGWAVVRATVVDMADGAPLPGALLLVTQTDGNVLRGRGVTDWRDRAAGEALIAAPGIPAITFGAANNGDDGAVLVNQVEVTIEAIYDPQTPASDDLPPNPSDLEERRLQLRRASETVFVSAATSASVRIEVDLS